MREIAIKKKSAENVNKTPTLANTHSVCCRCSRNDVRCDCLFRITKEVC